MYDFSWHKHHGDMTSASAVKTLTRLREIAPFASVLDVGCGDGRWLAASMSLGVNDIQGVDGPWTDLADMMIPGETVRIHNLSDSFSLERTFDLAMSMEVAEHVAPSSADRFVANLTRHSDFVLFGAAIPHQGGFRHINEQWQSYWRDRFAGQGYVAFDPLRRALWDEPDVHYWYKQNMLVYVRESRADLIASMKDYLIRREIAELPINIVHPDKYAAIASYDEIAFKPLMRKLPARAASKIANILTRRT